MKLSVFILFLFLGYITSLPVEQNPAEIKIRFRQDGEDGDGEGVGEIEQVGEQVSKIIQGVLTGNFGQIFSGSTGFIEDGDTQSGVGNILSQVAVPLNTFLAQGVQQGQKYYNITNPPAILLHSTLPTSTTPTPASLQVVHQNVPTQQPNVQQVPVRQQAANRLPPAPVVYPAQTQLAPEPVVDFQPEVVPQPAVVETAPEPVIEAVPETIEVQPEGPETLETVDSQPEDPVATVKSTDDEDEDSDIDSNPKPGDLEELDEEEDEEELRILKESKRLTFY